MEEEVPISDDSTPKEEDEHVSEEVQNASETQSYCITETIITVTAENATSDKKRPSQVLPTATPRRQPHYVASTTAHVSHSRRCVLGARLVQTAILGLDICKTGCGTTSRLIQPPQRQHSLWNRSKTMPTTITDGNRGNWNAPSLAPLRLILPLPGAPLVSCGKSIWNRMAGPA